MRKDSRSLNSTVAALATNEAGWQAGDVSSISGATVCFTISYRDPTTGKDQSLHTENRIGVGREPIDAGLVLSSAEPDMTISANALEITCEEGRVKVRNTSSQNNFEMKRLSSGDRTLLLVGDTLEISQDVEIFLEGSVHEHKMTIKLDNNAASIPEPLTTQSLIPPDYALVDDRREVMAHLCAPLMYPHRYPFHETKAPDIAQRIARSGSSITSREVNNKIQREREKVNDECNLVLSTREELAQFLVDHNFITLADVDHFVLGR